MIIHVGQTTGFGELAWCDWVGRRPTATTLGVQPVSAAQTLTQTQSGIGDRCNDKVVLVALQCALTAQTGGSLNRHRVLIDIAGGYLFYIYSIVIM